MHTVKYPIGYRALREQADRREARVDALKDFFVGAVLVAVIVGGIWWAR